MKRLTWQRAVELAHAERDRRALRLMFAAGTIGRSDRVLAAHVKHRQRFA